MNRKVRVFDMNMSKNIGKEWENTQNIRKFVKLIEGESIRSLIMNSDSIKSEGKLAKEINFSDFI